MPPQAPPPLSGGAAGPSACRAFGKQRRRRTMIRERAKRAVLGGQERGRCGADRIPWDLAAPVLPFYSGKLALLCRCPGLTSL